MFELCCVLILVGVWISIKEFIAGLRDVSKPKFADTPLLLWWNEEHERDYQKWLAEVDQLAQKEEGAK